MEKLKIKRFPDVLAESGKALLNDNNNLNKFCFTLISVTNLCN